MVAASVSGDKNEVTYDDYPPEKQRTKEELLGLIDYYNNDYLNDQSQFKTPHPLSYDTRCQIPDNPQSHDNSYTKYTQPADLETKRKLKNLKKALLMKPTDLDEIYLLYRSLPDTRIHYLCPKIRHRLLHVLSVVEFKSEHSMRRYLSVIDDLKASGIPLILSEWNSAISYVARYVRKTTPVEVEAALRLWTEMEHTAGMKGDNVTFNILFDAAYRAGKFNLAQMVYKEMDARDLRYTRYHYVTYIMYHGMRQDGDGVRTTYQQLIEAGEIVDTLVLNAMMSALIQAREPNSAANLYERMKKAHLARANPKIAPKHFESRRAANKALMRATRLTAGDRAKRDELQRRSMIGPDSITYLILVDYFSVKVGDLDKTAALLEEMKWFALPVYGTIFVKIFKGFFIHGGVHYSSWTGTRLELVYKSFSTSLEAEDTDLFLSWGMAMWILRAFGRCRGPSRALSVWEDLRSKWDPEPTDLEYLTADLNHLAELESAQKRHAINQGLFQ
ncbi:hypothetical protein K3495_g942 [Podosphaera aphanis]|nr:hypothetical protein K3495_g942 [Podosphaera aphanis]